MAKVLKRVGFGAAGVLTLSGILKIAKITSDEDWELVRYKVKKMRTSGAGKKSTQEKPKVVVLGTGWGSISFIHQLDLDEVDLTIVSPRSYFFYTPLLAGTATGTVSSSSIIEPIRWYCKSESGAKFVQAECTGVDVKGKVISCRGSVSSSVPSFTIPYDHLVIAVGAEPATFNIPGVKEHATFMKEIEDGVSVKRQILQKLENAHSMLVAGVPQSEVDKQLTWIVVGGGPTGVELCAEITDFINADVKRYFPSLVPHINVMLVEALPRVLTMFDDQMSSYATESLKQNGAKVICGAMVSKVTPTEVQLKVKDQAKMSSFNYGILVWAGGIAMRPITKSIAGQLANQQSRFGLEVDNHLHVKGNEDGSLWAIGDCAVNGCAPTAQAANQQGKYLGSLFRETGLKKSLIEAYPDFAFSYKGALAYVGSSRGIADLKNLWDIYPVGNQVKVEGTSAFAIWRSLYFSKLLSSRNQAQVAFDWIKSWLFGRDIATPAGATATDDRGELKDNKK